MVTLIPTRPRAAVRATMGTETLIASAVLAHIQQHGTPPRVVEMSALRLLSIPSSRWERFVLTGIPGLGMLTVRQWSAPAWITGYDTDTMICLA